MSPNQLQNETKPFDQAELMPENDDTILTDKAQNPNDWSVVSSCPRKEQEEYHGRMLIEILDEEAFHSHDHYDGRVE